MVGCVAVKVTVDKGRPKFRWDEDYETAMARKNEMSRNRNVQSTQHARICHAYCFENPGRKKMPF